MTYITREELINELEDAFAKNRIILNKDFENRSRFLMEHFQHQTAIIAEQYLDLRKLVIKNGEKLDATFEMVGNLTEKVELLAVRVGNLEKQINKLKVKFDKLENRICQLESKTDKLIKEVKEIKSRFKEKIDYEEYVKLEHRITILENKIQI